MRKAVVLLFFLVLVEEGRSLYADHMFAPFHWVHGILVEPIAKVRPFDVLMAAVLAYSALGGGPRAQSVQPLRRTLFVALAMTVFAFAYGMLTGGDARAAGWQAYLPIAMVVGSFAFASQNVVAEHFVSLWRALLAAAVWHGLMCVYFHVAYVRGGLVTPLPEYAGTHDDTVLFTVGIGLLLSQALLLPSRRTRLLAFVLVPLLLAAIQANGRRLAWVSLGGSILALYFVLPPSPARRKAQRVMLAMLPVLAIYVAVGWGRTENIFKPLRSFQTVSTDEDASTKARNAENLGLIATAGQGWLLGTGLGHKYVEVSKKYQIYFFELWPYVPHNSVLGLLAYTGYLGFIGYWMTFPVTAFLHARLARLGVRPVDRMVGMVGLVQVVACADQWYGDMGSFSTITMYTLASGVAAALRVPVAAGAWPAPARAVPAGAGVGTNVGAGADA